MTWLLAALSWGGITLQLVMFDAEIPSKALTVALATASTGFAVAGVLCSVMTRPTVGGPKPAWLSKATEDIPWRPPMAVLLLSLALEPAILPSSGTWDWASTVVLSLVAGLGLGLHALGPMTRRHVSMPPPVPPQMR